MAFCRDRNRAFFWTKLKQYQYVCYEVRYDEALGNAVVCKKKKKRVS